MKIVRIDASRILDGDTFHRVFAEAFGFPDFYGRKQYMELVKCAAFVNYRRIEMGQQAVLTLSFFVA